MLLTLQEVTKLREQFETIPDRNLVNAMRSLETYIQYVDSKVGLVYEMHCFTENQDVHRSMSIHVPILQRRG